MHDPPQSDHNREKMKHGSLFAGQGGFELAAHWMGWDNIFSVENNPFCDKVLKYRFKKSDRYEDIKEFNATKYRGAIDIISGGFPCQTFSLAGKGAMDLSLWKEMFRVIKECQPGWVVAENVFGLVVRKKGLALEMVCSDLEAEGFTVFPPLIIPACSTGAPHRRDRVWIIAYSDSNGCKLQSRKIRCQAKQSKVKENKWQWIWIESSRNAISRDITDTNLQGLQKRIQSGKYCFQRLAKAFQGREYARTYPKDDWSQFPTESPISARSNGIPSELGGYSRKRFSRLRKEGIKSSGNSINPQTCFEIFQAIEQFEIKS